MAYLTRAALMLTLSFTASAGWADKLSLNAISDYFNRLKTAEGTFRQVNDDGSVSTGRILIKRPGKMRFEYNPPDKTLVVATNNAVFIADGNSNQQPYTYPLKQTPLSIILARKVDLSQANMVVGHDYDGTDTIITAQDPKNPEYGYIQLKFTANPVQLREWVVTDSGGGQTTLVLSDLNTGGALPNRLFAPPQRGAD